MPAVQETIERVRHIDVDQYKYGFVTDIESDKAPKGLSEDTVRFRRTAARKSPVILRGSGFAFAPQDDGSTWK